MRLITQYRRRGHLLPKQIQCAQEGATPTLALETSILSENDLDIEFAAAKKLAWEKQNSEIYFRLEETYCASIGVEYRYMTNPDKVMVARKDGV